MNNFFKKNWQYLILGLFLSIGIYLRIGGVITNSFAFTYDVGRDLLEVQKVVSSFDIPLIGQTTGLGGLYYGPWWYYILTPPFFISGGNPQGIALFMVVLGILTILLGYIFGIKLSGKSLGVIIAGFLSFSAVLVGFSSQIWNPNIAPLFLILLFITIFLKFKDKNKELIRKIIIGFLLGVILDAEIVFGVLMIGSIGIFYIWLERKKVFSKDKLYILFGFILTLLPRAIFELRHNFIMTKSLFLPKEESQRIFDLQNFFVILPERIEVFLNQIGETFGVGILQTVIICVLTIFILLRFKNKLKKIEVEFLFLQLIIVAVFLIGSSFFARAIWGHYIVGLPVVYIIIVSTTLTVLIRKNKWIGISLFLLMLTASIRPLDVYNNLNNPYWEGNAAVYRNQLAVLDYIYKDADGREFNYIAYTPVVHDYTYQYLFSWYGKKKYGSVPKKETKGLLYVILEPDPGYEWRIDDWLKIREGDGKVITESVVKGGISVQERKR